MTIFRTLAIGMASLCMGIASAQSAAPDAGPACSGDSCHLAAGTTVELELTDPVSSRDRQHGDHFGLRLHAPLLVDGATILPAGTPGVGEVVHADHARGGGKPGELILAARYLQAGTVQVPLHGMKLGATGKDHSGASIAVGAAIGPLALFIHGGEIEIPSGTIAQARLLQDVDLPMPDNTRSSVAATKTESPDPATPPTLTTPSSTPNPESH